MMETDMKADESDIPRNPEITVLICSHRREFLLEAVESSVNQTLDKNQYEIIVVFDYYDEILQSTISKLGVRIYMLEQDSWGEKLALGISASRGKIICFLDDDDKFKETKLARIKEVFDAYSNATYAHNSSQIMQSDSKDGLKNLVSHKSAIVERVDPRDFSNTVRLYRELAPLRFDFNASSISVRKDIIEVHLELLRTATALIDSIIFYIALCSAGDLIALKDTLTEYRLHESVSNTSQEGMASLRKFVDWSGEIERSLDLAANSLDSPAMKYIITGKKLSVGVLRDVFDVDKQETSLNSKLRFFKFHFFNRPVYATGLLVLSVAKKVLPKAFYSSVACLAFKSFLKLI